MDITPILTCGLKIRQIVDKPTRRNNILDVLFTNLPSMYQTPIIVPPITADNPETAKSSDHSVPVRTPHVDRFQRPVRNYKIIKFRPLPDSGVRNFGNWIVNEKWNTIEVNDSATDKAIAFEDIVMSISEQILPPKTMQAGAY